MSPSSYQLLHSAIYPQLKLLYYYNTLRMNVNTFLKFFSFFASYATGRIDGLSKTGYNDIE